MTGAACAVGRAGSCRPQSPANLCPVLVRVLLLIMVLRRLLVFIAFTGSCWGELSLSPELENAERAQNESYIVTCHGPGAVGTAWRGPGNKTIPARAGRVHTEERETGAVSLVFENIHRNDKGSYTCTSTIDNKQSSISFNLTVVRPIKFISGLAHQNLTEHQNGLVRCEASGEPKPTIVWSLNGKTVEGPRFAIRANGLHILNVTKEDEGPYLCRAFQVTSQTSTLRDQLITVSVNYKPQWKGRQLDWFGYIGGISNLTCEVDAKPPADFVWTRLDQTLDSPRIITEPNRSVLQVNVTDKSVFGKYECRAWNGVGNVSRVAELKEGTKPNPPTKVILEQADSVDQIRLRVTWATEDPDPVGVRVEFQEFKESGVSWNHPEYQDLYIDDGPLTLNNLKSNTDYVLRVATLGLAGLSDYAEEMRYITSTASFSYPVSILFTLVMVLVNLLK